MKKLKLIASVIVLIIMGKAVNAQTSATATANAKIVSAISVVKDRDLDFGSIVPAAGASGTVTIAASSSSAASASGVVLTSATTQSAKFTVSGDGNATYAITRVPANGTPI